MTSSAAHITVRRNDESYGPYSLADVNQLLMSGRLDGDDLAWLEGTPDWTQLRAIPGVIAVPPVPGSARHEREGEQHDPDCSDRLILPAFLMAFFVGPLGVHRFYVGKNGSAIAMLVLTLTLIGIFISAIWAFIDWIVIVSGSFRDGEDRLLKKWT